MSATQGTQAEARLGEQVCATESAALAQSVVQAPGAAQASGVTLTQNAELHLLPRPREVKEAGGAAFKVTRRTRIVVSNALGGRDFEGAQMLEDEVEQWTGWQLKISDAREMPGGADIIYVGDATKDSKLRDALEKQGLTMAQEFDEQGYEISVDAHRILVGGASAEGAFNGVQTLRQLLRPAKVNSAKEKAKAHSSSRLLLGMTNKNKGEVAGGAQKTAKADSSSRLLLGMTDTDNDRAEGDARFVNVALRAGLTGAQNKSVKEARSNGASGGGADETAEASSSAPFANAATGLPSPKRLRAGGMTTEKKVGELECPAIAIRDWPAMKWRGVSIDISRGPIPTLKFMENQIRVLAGFKINMYALYMEDVFTVPGTGIFAPPDALTPDEIRELVSYAQRYYVTVVPELETYGHLHNVLRYDVYSQLAEVPHGSVLTPTQPGSYDLLGKMIAAMAPIFKGPFFH
ncbi:MAG TPA: glycoside hydrolase family 20 zincin-like fold domain-containing protein, partial [Candidatus Acidoferrales bacterium]|nr:glycoside hydrolase family 20 zincin-like fold domain-containing protein [Candidatus Acidoferrales bacterium]